MGPNTFDLSELEALFALLRRNGIEHFSQGGLSVSFGTHPPAEIPEQKPENRRLPAELRGLPSEYFDPALGIGFVAK